MVDRISSASKSDLLVKDMQQNLANYNKITAQLASGYKFDKITEDPIAAVNILNTNRQLGQIETFSTNVEMASAELSALDDLMALATGYLSDVWDRAMQANNQTYNGASLEALKVEVDETIKTMVDLANTEYNDNYIFGGANTKNVPYEIDENGDIIYSGTPHDNPDYIRQTEVADGVFEVINTTGDKVFGYYRAEVPAGQGVYTDANGNRVIEHTDDAGVTTYKYENGIEFTGDPAVDLTDGAPEEYSGVMGAMKLLSNSIDMVLNGDSTEGYKLMNSTLDMFADSHNTIVTEQTKFGGVANRLDMTTSTLETSNESLTAYLTEIRDIDLTTAISEWMQAQYAYQASLQVSSSAMGMSLLNYM